MQGIIAWMVYVGGMMEMEAMMANPCAGYAEGYHEYSRRHQSPANPAEAKCKVRAKH